MAAFLVEDEAVHVFGRVLDALGFGELADIIVQHSDIVASIGARRWPRPPSGRLIEYDFDFASRFEHGGLASGSA